MGPKEKTKRDQLDPLPTPGKPTLVSTADDLSIMPKSPSSYARSGDMYSHTGTMPRARSSQRREQAEEKVRKPQQDPVLCSGERNQGHNCMQALKAPAELGERAAGGDPPQKQGDGR